MVSTTPLSDHSGFSSVTVHPGYGLSNEPRVCMKMTKTYLKSSELSVSNATSPSTLFCITESLGNKIDSHKKLGFHGHGHDIDQFYVCIKIILPKLQSNTPTSLWLESGVASATWSSLLWNSSRWSRSHSRPCTSWQSWSSQWMDSRIISVVAWSQKSTLQLGIRPWSDHQNEVVW